MSVLGPIKTERRSGSEPFHNQASPVADLSVLDFWQWSCSDLVSNATRGILAEYIVGKALSCEAPIREEWAAFDLETPSGITIEVKSAAYVQSWHQERHSPINFGIQPTTAWDASTAAYDTVPKRQAQVYVFALLAHQDQETLDPLDLGQWRFHVLPTAVLNDARPTQKNISLGALQRLDPVEVGYAELRQAVENAAASSRSA